MLVLLGKRGLSSVLKFSMRSPASLPRLPWCDESGPDRTGLGDRRQHEVLGRVNPSLSGSEDGDDGQARAERQCEQGNLGGTSRTSAQVAHLHAPFPGLGPRRNFTFSHAASAPPCQPIAPENS